jgi:hypothetical protein
MRIRHCIFILVRILKNFLVTQLCTVQFRIPTFYIYVTRREVSGYGKYIQTVGCCTVRYMVEELDTGKSVMVISRQLQIANFRSQSLEMENIFPHYSATCVDYTSSYVCKTAAIQDICRYRNVLGTGYCVHFVRKLTSSNERYGYRIVHICSKLSLNRNV